MSDRLRTRVSELEKLVEEYRILLATSEAIAASTGLTDTLALLTRLVTESLDAGWCDIYDCSAARDEFVVSAFYQRPGLGIDTSGWIGTRYDMESWKDFELCVRERRPSISYRDDPAIRAGEAADTDKRHELSSMTVPLVCRGEVVGLIDVGESRSLRRWSEDDVRVLLAIADQAAVAVVSARAYERPAEQAITDGVTGLVDRRHFNEQLLKEVTTARRYGSELSLVMIDVDDFKSFTDRFGHPLGDGVLAEIAELLLHDTRNHVDVVARYGGDEFALIMPQTRAGGTEPTAARNVAERIRATVAAHPFEGSQGRRDVRVTISVGVAGLGLGGYTAGELLGSADKALYISKHLGKDRVSVFGT